MILILQNVKIRNVSLILQKMVRVKLPSFHATVENSKRNSNTKGELMRGRYGERISIYSEDLSVPIQTNEFRFCSDPSDPDPLACSP